IFTGTMKCTIPEISWHNRDPVLTVDIQHNAEDNIYRLATGGTDTTIIIWQLKILEENGATTVEALSELTRHNRAVNAVRFSPDGQMLASSDDEASIIIWHKQSEPANEFFGEDSPTENKENWTLSKMLRGHLEDVYDICWSPCSLFLISGSVDNAAILWNVGKGKNLGLLGDHKGFVQGVAWDPQGQYVSTLCSDRNMRLFNITNKKVLHRVQKAKIPVLDDKNEVTEKTTKLFYDDTLKSFCRRLCFSPDGEIIAAPSGILEEESGKNTNVTYLFSRHNPSVPALYLPTDKYTIAVRFCPLLFDLKPIPKEKQEDQDEAEEYEEGEFWRQYRNLFELPYRMIFAVATQNGVILYDTQQGVPFAKISNIHYTRLSDLAWSDDGRLLVVSSTDGYCSLVSFSEGELGTSYKEKVASLVVKNIESHMKTKNRSPSVSPKPLEKKSAKSPNTEAAIVSMASAGTAEVAPALSSSADGSTKTIHTDNSEEPMETSTTKDSTEVATASKHSSSNESPAIAAKPTFGIRSAKGKRMQLITLSKPGQKTDENTPEKTPTKVNGTPQENNIEIDEEIKQRFEPEAAGSTSKMSPTKVPTTPSSKTPRRVPLVTLSSPKGKKKIMGDTR
ncbi:unnamed protein product, partial [Meganyctiphanes norvegica]